MQQGMTTMTKPMYFFLGLVLFLVGIETLVFIRLEDITPYLGVPLFFVGFFTALGGFVMSYVTLVVWTRSL